MSTFTYPAMRYKQLPDDGSIDRTIICMVAPCDEILQWAGIPRKAETVSKEDGVDGKPLELHGYQREAAHKRLKQLAQFFQTPANVIPTSVLLARRFKHLVTFTPEGQTMDFGGVTVEVGTITISPNVGPALPMSQLLGKLAECLILRRPELQTIKVNEALLARWKEALSTGGDEIPPSQNSTSEASGEDEATEEPAEEEIEQTATNPYSPDQHIEDFYREVRLRQWLCEQLPFLEGRDSVLGLSREMVLDYLAPVTVVDGQHRLLGAKEALDHVTSEYMSSESVLQELGNGASGQSIEDRFRRRERRVFSATMLMDSDWSEHVFQFVVVNQQVKPITKALLSSIISTSLNAAEIAAIQDRLDSAGIEIDDYRIMGRLTEDPKSPFKGFVKRGYTADKKAEKKKLEWAVLNNIAHAFRELVELKPYDQRGPGYIDKAQEWKREYLLPSPMMQEHTQATGLEDFQAWSDPVNGLWLELFFDFWTTVRAKLADNDNDLARWGERPEISNLFNGATMKSIQADFFEFLHEKEVKPESVKDFHECAARYVSKMKPEFFGREWRLPGNRVDRPNMETVAKYLRLHRQTGKIDGKWTIFSK